MLAKSGASEQYRNLQHHKDPVESTSMVGDDTSVASPSPQNEIRKREGVTDLMRVIALPVINIAITCVLIGLTIYVYQTANGQPSDLKLAGMNVSTVLSLLMTIAKMFVAGGITYAISEYKWVKLQNNGGVLQCSMFMMLVLAGIVRVVSALRFDLVIIPTLVFQIGLMAMGPASQQILGTTDTVMCKTDGAAIWYTNYSYYDLTSMRFPRVFQDLKGFKNDFLATYAYEQVSKGFATIPHFNCDDKAVNCTYTDVGGLTTRAVCTPGDVQAEIVDIHTNNKTTLANYLGLNKSTDYQFTFSDLDVPQAFYHGSMLGRTHYDLANLTVPTTEIVAYDPTLRRYFGEQKFVLVLSDEGTLDIFVDSAKDLKVLICTLQTNYTVSDIVYRNELMYFYNQRSEPFELDYDLLSNNTYWQTVDQFNLDHRTINTYATQLTHMKLLVGNPTLFQHHASQWKVHGLNASFTHSSPTDFLRAMLKNTDLVIMYGIPDFTSAKIGTRCWINHSIYNVNPGDYYGLALMVTGFTPAVRNQLRGMSHAGQRELFKKAKSINVVFGEHRNTGHITFGQPDELDPVRTKREAGL